MITRGLRDRSTGIRSGAGMTSSGYTVVGESSITIAPLVVHRSMICIIVKYTVASIGIRRALEERHCYGLWEGKDASCRWFVIAIRGQIMGFLKRTTCICQTRNVGARV